VLKFSVSGDRLVDRKILMIQIGKREKETQDRVIKFLEKERFETVES